MIAFATLTALQLLPGPRTQQEHVTASRVAHRNRPPYLLVDAVESTPAPSSFLLRLDAPLDDVEFEGFKGVTFYKVSCPASLEPAFKVDGVESIFACNECLTVNKVSSAGWGTVLPAVIEALGGPSSKLEASGLPSSSSSAPAATGAAAASSGVSIRLQISLGLPIQVEANGWTEISTPVRAKLSPRFGSAMGLLVGQSGDAFFAGRQWLERGVRYPEGTGEGDADEDALVAAALAEEVAEVEAAYPDDRIASLIFGSKEEARASGDGNGGGAGGAAAAADGDDLLSFEQVDQLCDEEDANNVEEVVMRGASGPTDAVCRLAAFVRTGRGALGARRNAIAYLGSTAGRGGDVALEAVQAAFTREKAAGVRRTAGDALSDLGDPRAVLPAVGALADRSALVRWRAARIIGEMGDSAAALAALKQAAVAEQAFEVAFEIKDAARKVQARLDSQAAGTNADNSAGAGAGTGPMWKQIQDGLSADGMADGLDA